MTSESKICALSIKLLPSPLARGKDWQSIILFDETTTLKSLQLTIQKGLNFDSHKDYVFSEDKNIYSEHGFRIKWFDTSKNKMTIDDLSKLLLNKNKFYYLYDFGVDWLFELTFLSKKTTMGILEEQFSEVMMPDLPIMLVSDNGDLEQYPSYDTVSARSMVIKAVEEVPLALDALVKKVILNSAKLGVFSEYYEHEEGVEPNLSVKDYMKRVACILQTQTLENELYMTHANQGLISIELLQIALGNAVYIDKSLDEHVLQQMQIWEQFVEEDVS